MATVTAQTDRIPAFGLLAHSGRNATMVNTRSRAGWGPAGWKKMVPGTMTVSVPPPPDPSPPLELRGLHQSLQTFCGQPLKEFLKSCMPRTIFSWHQKWFFFLIINLNSLEDIIYVGLYVKPL